MFDYNIFLLKNMLLLNYYVLICIDEEEWKENPIKMKQFVLSRINKMPQEVQDMVDKTSLSSISIAPITCRSPWNILFGNLVKDNVCAVGDALHPMTSDIGQGGCSSLEDSVVLGRCLAEAILNKSNDQNDEFERIRKGLGKYANERRWRSFSLICVGYCVGYVQERDGKFFNFLRNVWFGRHIPSSFLNMANFDCGHLVP